MLAAALAFGMAAAGCDTKTGDGGTSVPGIPAGVTAAAQSSNSIGVSWSAVSGATGYEVYGGTSASPSALLATVADASYIHTGLPANTTYYYRVKAANSAGSSDYSSSCSARTPASGGGDSVSLAGLAGYLASLASNTAANPHTVILDASVTINTADTSANGVWATINRTVQVAEKYVILDISACSAVDNTIAGENSVTLNNYNYFNIIKGNTYIKGVMLPSTLTSIGDYAFSGCSGLSSVTIPDGVTSIGGYAFYNCSGLTGALTIPDGVTSLGDGAFGACGLTGVTFGADSNITTAWHNDTFQSNSGYGSTGNSLWTAYTTGNKPGTYIRSGNTWAKPGTATQDDIAITFWVNERDSSILASNDRVTISKTGPNASFTAEVTGGYDSVRWSVNGAPGAETRSIHIAAAGYLTGTYRLGVRVSKDGVPYSTEITFTVTE
jgi:hypothetical protein